MSKKSFLYILQIIFARFNFTGSHDIYWIYGETPRALCHLRVQAYQKIFVYESSNYEHSSETILDIRDAKWFMYFECLSTLLYLYLRCSLILFIISWHRIFLFHICPVDDSYIFLGVDQQSHAYGHPGSPEWARCGEAQPVRLQGNPDNLQGIKI